MPGLTELPPLNRVAKTATQQKPGTITLSGAAAFSIVCSFLLLAIAGFLWASWATRHSMLGGPRLTLRTRKAVLAAAVYLPRLSLAVSDLGATLRGEPTPLLLDAAGLDEQHCTNNFPSIRDPGYLLLSHVSKSARQSIVSLIRIADGRTLATWQPDIAALNAQRRNSTDAALSKFRLRIVNPLLMPDGDIVYNTMDGPLIRQAVCGSVSWLRDDPHHHSNELDAAGNIWGPAIYKNPFPDNPYLNEEVRGDAVSKVSPDGKLLGLWSFSQILIANGLRGLLLGHSAEKFMNDPIHMNDIQPALTSSKYWEKGDLLISARHLSTVFLLRPGTGNIVWYKTGPWLNQHDVNFLGDSQITVFGDDIISAAPPGGEFLKPGDTNQIYVYNFASDAVSTPFAELMKQQRVRTVTEGRGTVLADGGLFVEETNFGRILRFTKDKLLWSRVNWYDGKRIGLVSWSRYLTEDEVRGPLAAIAASGCGTH